MALSYFAMVFQGFPRGALVNLGQLGKSQISLETQRKKYFDNCLSLDSQG
jgi:hypothetical protein